jgi:hypothetical protein
MEARMNGLCDHVGPSIGRHFHLTTKTPSNANQHILEAANQSYTQEQYALCLLKYTRHTRLHSPSRKRNICFPI